MNDYKELVGRLRVFCLPCHGEEKSIGQSAADVIEHLQSKCERLVSDYEILAKMYAKVNEDLCVRTKERDAAVADLKSVLASECGLNQCRYCKYQEDDYQCHHDCIPYSEKWGWEWRGVQEDNDEID